MCIIWCTFTERSLFTKHVNSNINENIYYKTSIRSFQEQLITYQHVCIRLRIRVPRAFLTEWFLQKYFRTQVIPASQMHIWCTYGARYKRTPNCFISPKEQEWISFLKMYNVNIYNTEHVEFPVHAASLWAVACGSF